MMVVNILNVLRVICSDISTFIMVD